MLLTDLEAGQITHMTATAPPIIVADDQYSVSAFMIGGSNYYTLASLSELLGFSVTEDETGVLQLESVSGEAGDTASPAA